MSFQHAVQLYISQTFQHLEDETTRNQNACKILAVKIKAKATF